MGERGEAAAQAMEREGLETRLRALCGRAGFEVQGIEWLSAGLGARHFARLRVSQAPVPSLIARIDTPEDPALRPKGSAPEPPLEAIRACLEAHALPVPRRFGGDACGIDLLEDFGEQSLEAAVADALPEERQSLYREACDPLARLQRVESCAGVAAFERRLDRSLIAYKARLFADAGLALRGRAASPAEREVVERAFAAIADEVDAAPRRLAHRDYQSANLFVRPGAPDGARIGWIDFQGAFLAPPEYDLVCLLCDSYVELPDAERCAQIDAVRPRLPDAPDAEDFARRFDLLTLTRKGKDLARFVQAAERGDRRYERYLPTTIRHLQRAAPAAAARDARFAGLAALIAELIAGSIAESIAEGPESPCAR